MKKKDFYFIFDVMGGNPNGDPDNDNMPRMDYTTGKGIVSAQCLKRKVRNAVSLIKAGANGYDLFIKDKSVLDTPVIEALEKSGAKVETDKNNLKTVAKNGATNAQIEKAVKTLCEKFFDVRWFGGVLATTNASTSITGPISINTSFSVSPINPETMTITRMAVTKEEKADEGKTMGRIHYVPYGLYTTKGHVTPYLAKKTNVSEEDIELFFQVLTRIFEFDHAAARGDMTARKLIVFEHDSELGSAPEYMLYDLIKVTPKTENPCSFDDYEITIDYEHCPAGVTIKEYIYSAKL